jgi:isocitrate dehydrogenase kinase/phosphatase
VLADDSIVPFVVALLNSAQGIYADAVLHRVSDIHDLFSSALANFHVTTRLYYQTCVFLFSLMPRRPFGHQYSTIGFNHVGKVAILNEIIEQMPPRTPPAALARRSRHGRARLHLRGVRVSPEGHPRPADQFLQVGRVSGGGGGHDKYRVVHEINRAGSMLDNVMYFNLRLDREMFDPALLEEICRRPPAACRSTRAACTCAC